MADIEFQVTDGPYAGRYDIDFTDISAADVGDLVSQGGPDLDETLGGGKPPGLRTFAALVWMVRRRGSSKGLAYRAVAEHITRANVGPVEDGTAEAPAGAGLPDPSPSAGD